MFSLICARINSRVNNREAGDLIRHRAHYDVTVMTFIFDRIDLKKVTFPNSHEVPPMWKNVNLSYI